MVWRFLFRRLLLIAPLLLFILFFTFMLVRIGGHDPVALLAGPLSTVEEVEAIRTEFGLDKPMFTQFWIYIQKVAQGDLGESWFSKRPVMTDLVRRAPVTLELLLWGVGLGALIGVPVGLRAARRRGRAFDQIVRFVSLLGFSTPTYWLGLVMILVFFFYLGWAPPAMGRIDLIISSPPDVTGSYLIDGLLAGDWEAAHSAFAHLVLPVIAIAIVSAAPIIKQTRVIALDVLASEYVRTAEAAGVGPANIRRIAFRNSVTPVITFIGTELTGLVGTASVTEFIFAWGGVGQYGLQSIIAGDFAAVQGYVLALALFSVLVFLVIDLLVAIFEPRAEMQA